jgi:Cu+-exporting ATPase
MPDIKDISCVDPVCGHKINPKNSLKINLEGNNYYFCSKKCFNSFKKNPGKYSIKAHNNSLFKKKVTSNLDNSDLFNKEIILKVSGMSGDQSIEKIQATLALESGITKISSNLAEKKITIKFNPDLLSEKEILEIIEKTGYTAEYIKKATSVFVLKGINHASYSNKLEETLNKCKGVLETNVNFATEEITINYLVDETNTSTLTGIIENAGYKAIPIHDLKALSELKIIKAKEINKIKEKTFISFILSLVIFVFNANNISDYIPEFIRNHFLSLLLATPVQFWGGSIFYKDGIKALKKFELDNNVLALLATTTVYFFSLVLTFYPEVSPGAKPCFEVSSVLVTIFLLSLYFTAMMKENISGTLERVTALQPQKVKRLENNKIEEIPINFLQVEDIINIEPGEKIPVDGVITDGSSFIDEFIFSGDSTPVMKSKGANVISGSINKSSPFNMQVTKIGRETFLARYISYLETAFCSKTNLQNKYNLLIKFFPLLILVSAILTFSGWLILSPSSGVEQALLSAVSVIAVNIPCLLALSIPFSIIIGINKSTESGWIYKNAGSLETASKVDTIIFDKTGILTKAKPIITDIMTFNGFDGNTVLKIAASIENHSEHILGNAIVQEAKNKNFDLWIPTDFHYIIGMGIEANVNGFQTIIGSKQLMRLKNVEMDPMGRMARKLSGEGKTTIFIAISGKAAGIIAVSDIIKDDSNKALEKLKRLGLELVLLTGDNLKTAAYFAEQTGIKSGNVIAEASPTKKIKIISSLQKEGRVVAVVSDKIDDSPSLKKADLVISFKNTFNNSSDVNIINFFSNDLGKIAVALQFSKRIMRTVRQNLYWSFIYYLVGIPVASGLFIPLLGIHPEPIIIGLSTLVSFIFILINAMELRKITPH